MSVDVNSSEESKPTTVSKPTCLKNYNFTSESVAIIFNQTNVRGEEKREGSQKDADDLKLVLSEFGFSVKVCNDFTKTKIKKELLTCNTFNNTRNSFFI